MTRIGNNGPITIALLKGGLGNQMFQYAAARGIALRLGGEVRLDIWTGFRRDRVFRRKYALSPFAVQASYATTRDQLILLTERIRSNWMNSRLPVRSTFGGMYVGDCDSQRLAAVARGTDRVYLDGYFQSQQYFAGHESEIAQELAPAECRESGFRRIAETIWSCNAVGVGVRLFEEVPGATKVGVGGLVAPVFYERTAEFIATQITNPVFFVFCTTSAVVGTVQLPGPTVYVTHDNGFQGDHQRLWLMSQCRHHIIANSSFYWWAAWLARRRSPGITCASDNFTNPTTIPPDWLAFSGNGEMRRGTCDNGWALP